MKVTKYQHSCLVVEDNGIVALVDPGNYSNPPIDEMQVLTYILVTHEHQDHMHVPLIKQAVEKFPSAKIIGPSTVKTALEKEGLKVSTEADGEVKITNAPHHVIMGNQTENYLFTVFGKLSHPGDSFEFEKSADILALPITAPWGSLNEALQLAIKIKPKRIIPIHDWHLKDEARIGFYQWTQGYLHQQGIEFSPIESGEPIDLK